MEKDEELEQTNETENVETQTTEENVEGIELTDTAEVEAEEQPTEEKEEVKKTLRELLKENPEYQEEYNQMMKARLDRKEREFEKELSKYRDTEEVLKSTLGANDIDEANTKLRQAYEEQGVKLPDVYKPGLTSREIEALAMSDANEFIEEGYDSMVSEANRLATIGYKNLNEREKILFNTLANKISEANDIKGLKKIGVKEDILKDENFKSFRKDFLQNTPIEKIYALYKGSQPKAKVENPGSMKNTPTEKSHDFYTDEEINKLTLEDLDKPGVFEAVRRSMTSQKK